VWHGRREEQQFHHGCIRVVSRLIRSTRVLIKVVHEAGLVGRPNFANGADAVGVFPSLVPFAVRNSVAVAVSVRGIGAVFAVIVVIRKPILIRVHEAEIGPNLPFQTMRLQCNSRYGSGFNLDTEKISGHNFPGERGQQGFAILSAHRGRLEWLRH
jgi:hypothetical protein